MRLRVKGEIHMEERNIKRGDIFYCNMPNQTGHIQTGYRPVVVVQNDIGNKCSPTVIIAPLTSRSKAKLPTHISVNSKQSNLRFASTLLCEQLQLIDKSNLLYRVGRLSYKEEDMMNKALIVSLALACKQTTEFKPFIAA